MFGLRTREFGIRLALGATPKRRVVLVLRQSAGLAVGLGLCVAAGAGRVLLGVSPTDHATSAAIAVLLLVVALGAAALPARRARRSGHGTPRHDLSATLY